jgi:hypothetical protein
MKLTRILLTLIIGGGLAAAVFGSAASITLTVPKLGADTAAVASCDTALTTSWDSAYDATLGAYEVTTVTVSAIDGVACENGTLKVTLSNTSNAALGSEKTASIASTDTSKALNFSADNIAAENVANVNVVIVGP